MVPSLVRLGQFTRMMPVVGHKSSIDAPGPISQDWLGICEVYVRPSISL